MTATQRSLWLMSVPLPVAVSCAETDQGLGLVAIAVDSVPRGVLGEGLTGFDWI